MDLEPDWGDFRVLLALAGGGSVAGAARTLQVDNSTVSRRLAALEAAVGATLIIRGGREFNWTAEGRALLATAQAMEAALRQGVRTVQAAKAEVEGNVRLSVPPGFLPMLMQQLVPALRARHPRLHLELNGAYGRADLAKGEADVALRMVRPCESDLVARRAGDCGWFVFASEAYIAANGKPAAPEALSQHRLVLYAEPMHNVAPLGWLEAYRGSQPPASRVDNLEIACQAVAADVGIGVLPGFFARLAPNLRHVFDEPIGLNTAWIVYHESVRDTARVRAVVQGLAEFFEVNEGLVLGKPGV